MLVATNFLFLGLGFIMIRTAAASPCHILCTLHFNVFLNEMIKKDRYDKKLVAYYSFDKLLFTYHIVRKYTQSYVYSYILYIFRCRDKNKNV